MNSLKIKIDHLNDFGDGVAFSSDDKKIFIPYVIEGEEVEAELILEKKDFSRAKMTNIISPSTERVEAPCIYYNKCGGCNLQHLSQQRYFKFKERILENILRKTGFSVPKSEIYYIGEGTRHRAHFKVKNNKIGYYRHASSEVIAIDKCLVLNSTLNNIINLLNKVLSKIGNNKINDIALTSCDNGVDCLFSIADQLTLNEKNIIIGLISNSAIIRMSYKINDFIETFYLKEMPQTTIAGYKINIPQNSFLQASPESISIMANIITKYSASYKNVADLFAGFGSYGYVLCKNAHVTSYEENFLMVKTINESALQYNLNIKGSSRDLFKKPLKRAELSNFDLIIINPPRAGAAKQIENFRNTDIIMISCNPITFVKDAKILKENGYIMQNLYGIDQFHWTNHLELVAFFKAPN